MDIIGRSYMLITSKSFRVNNVNFGIPQYFTIKAYT